jgi:hypothetical protein
MLLTTFALAGGHFAPACTTDAEMAGRHRRRDVDDKDCEEQNCQMHLSASFQNSI